LPGNVGYAVAAGVTVDRVAIIAVLADIYDTITAALVRFAVRRATVAVDVVTVVTSLAGIDLAVAASGLAGRRNRADRIAAVGQAVAILVARGVAVVGELAVYREDDAMNRACSQRGARHLRQRAAGASSCQPHDELEPDDRANVTSQAIRCWIWTISDCFSLHKSR